MKQLSRRDFVKMGALAMLGGAGSLASSQLQHPHAKAGQSSPSGDHSPMDDGMGGGMGGMMPGFTGQVDVQANGFDPMDILTDFDYGTVSILPNGQTLREYTITALNKDIEVAPGIVYPAWTYNGRIPGPSLRATDGDHIKITFINGTSMPHSMHFHGFHEAGMDGVPGAGMVEPGQTFVYEFDAGPFGMHQYHCHAFPLARHIAKGLYGAFIVDPKGGRPPVDTELVMVMSGFDIDFDDLNDFYAVNAIPFYYQSHPIPLKVGAKVRIYLTNMLEFDAVNSFHLHANFFDYYPTGTSLTPSEFTDTIILGQAQRGILEFSYPRPGNFMFHAHVTEFSELGWTGNFEVSP